jgi:Ca2+-binding EF-hand superfamily protein
MQVSSVSDGLSYLMAASATQGVIPPPPPKKEFSEVDANSDGSISQDELSAILGQNASGTSPAGAPSAADIFSKIDTDENSSISSDEWDTFQQNIQQMAPPPPPNMDFSSVDTDGDGSISKTELSSAMPKKTDSASGKSSDDDKDSTLFSDIDTNGDGKISSAEWAAFQQKMQLMQGVGQSQDAQDGQQAATALKNMISKIYKSADTNGDGQISQAEMTAWLQGSESTSVSFAA